MAQNPLKPDMEAAIIQPPELKLKGDKLTQEVFDELYEWTLAVTRKINAGLTMGKAVHGQIAGNTKGQILHVLTPRTADVEFAVSHGLGTRCSGFWIIGPAAACQLYEATDMRGWSDNQLKLKATVADVWLWVFVK